MSREIGDREHRYLMCYAEKGEGRREKGEGRREKKVLVGVGSGLRDRLFFMG